MRMTVSTPAGAVPVHDRHADLADEWGLNPLERTTCHIHRRWLHDCVSSPLRVIVVTGHRWCRRCECAVDVAVDEVAGDVSLRCPRCRQTPAGAANRQVVRACRASLAAAAEGRGHGAPWTRDTAGLGIRADR